MCTHQRPTFIKKFTSISMLFCSLIWYIRWICSAARHFFVCTTHLFIVLESWIHLVLWSRHFCGVTFNVEQTKELHILNNSAACSNVRIENVKTIIKITAHHIIFTFFLLCWEKGGNNRKYSHEKLHFRVHFLRFE